MAVNSPNPEPIRALHAVIRRVSLADVKRLLFDGENVEQLSDALNWMVFHQQQAVEMGKEGQNKAQLHLFASKHYAEVMSVFRKVTGA